MEVLVKLLCLLLFTSQLALSEDEEYVIGGIFYEDEAVGGHLKEALEISAREFNFSTSIKTVKRGQVLQISGHVCALAEQGVIGIIDGLGGRGTEHVQAVCDILELPHVVVQHNDLDARNWSILSTYPSADAYNNLLTQLIMLKDWNNFTLLYVKGHSIKLMTNIMEMGNSTDPVSASIRELYGSDYRDVLINAKDQGYHNFVVDCPSEKIEQLLLHAQQVGLMADEHSYIFLSPDLFTLDLSRYRYGGVNMTGFRLFPSPKLQDFAEKLNNVTGGNDFEAETLKTKVVLIYDAVNIFSEGVRKITQRKQQKNVYEEDSKQNEDDFKPQVLSCTLYDAWQHGTSLLNFMKTNKIDGITGAMSFDGFGERDDVMFHILELTSSGEQKIGEWKNSSINLQRPKQPTFELSEDSIIRNKTFIVLFSATPPFGFLKATDNTLSGNDRYEGFAIDLMEELAEMLQFNFILELRSDYGQMAVDLANQRADFVVCDFTITTKRQKQVGFSTPFMTVGIGIIYKEPSKQPPAMFSFMAVFSKEVWLWMLFIQACIGVIMIFVGRISNKEWQNPVPCVEQPEELSNQFSLGNSIWLIIGSVMQQGSEIAPIALAPRMITSVWWFFTMVIVASYVGTLVAFLTVEKDVLPFTSVDELLRQKSIHYGAKDGGSTADFFRFSSEDKFQKMYKAMKDNKWLVEDNEVGVALAENSTYAFFMESSAIEYYRSRHCDLLQIGGLLDSKSYGIGMKQGSPYKPFIDNALLTLKESGKLQIMIDKWWKVERGGGKCGEKKQEEAKQLGMKNMTGAFVVLGGGCLIGIFISIFDMLWWVFKRSVKYNTSFKYELVEELKFALTFQGDVKPVKRPGKSSDGSGEALAGEVAKDEEKDELGSLRSARTIRSGRSTSTRRSVHSHCSRHSSSELSVAFAKRRQF